MSSKNSSNQVEEKADDEVLKDQNVQREKVPETVAGSESAQPSKPVKPPKPLGSKPSVVIGDTTVVPAFSMAKLMYYLRCVKTCVDLEISSRLIDYRNHQILTELEKRDVVTFAHRYRPDVLRNLIFFEVDERSSLLPSSANNFLSVDDPVVAEHFTLACNEITVDGVEYPIKKLLVFKYCWLHDFFSVPFAEENWRIGLSPKPVSYLSYLLDIM